MPCRAPEPGRVRRRREPERGALHQESFAWFERLGWKKGWDTPRPAGPNGERYHALSVFMMTAVKSAHYRNLYERFGFDATQVENVAGFGFSPEGIVDSLARFVSPPNFQFNTLQEVTDIIAFLLSISGELGSGGSSTDTLAPPGTPGRHTHAAVGAQVTFETSTPPAADVLRLDQRVALVDGGAVGLVAKGRHLGLARGYVYAGGNQFQSDRIAETQSRAVLTAQAGAGSELTLTVVPLGSQLRIGVDRDSDGAYDRDEIDGGGNPAGLTSTEAARGPAREATVDLSDPPFPPGGAPRARQHELRAAGRPVLARPSYPLHGGHLCHEDSLFPGRRSFAGPRCCRADHDSRSDGRAHNSRRDRAGPGR